MSVVSDCNFGYVVFHNDQIELLIEKRGGDVFRPAHRGVGSFSLHVCYVVFLDHQKELLTDISSIHTGSVVSACKFCYVVFPNYQKELLIDISRGVGSCNSCILDFFLICLCRSCQPAICVMLCFLIIRNSS